MISPEEQRSTDAHYREQNAREEVSDRLQGRIAKLESDLAKLQAKVTLARSALRAANLHSRPALIAERIEEAMNALE